MKPVVFDTPSKSELADVAERAVTLAGPEPMPIAAVAQQPLSRVTRPPVSEDDVADIGSGAANSLSKVSSTLMGHVKASDAGEFGQKLNELVVLAKGLDPKDMKPRGLLGRLMGTVALSKDKLVAQYATVEAQMDGLTGQLEGSVSLFKQRVNDLEDLYVQNMQYHENLEAAVQQCQTLHAQVQEQFAREQAIAVDNSFDALVLADYQRLLDRIAQHIDNLSRAMLLSKQMAPRIRDMQENSRALVQKFGSIKAVTLPAWKNIFSLYILQLEQKRGAELANAIDNATDEALMRGADLQRENTAAIAQARNRSVISLQALEHIQAQMLGAIADVQRIDEEGRARRRDEAPKLLAMEQELIAAFAPGKR